MIELSKEDITLFGNDSVATVKPLGIRGYGVVREADNVILASSHNFKKYMGDTITTMYTGSCYGTGDIVLKSDRHGIIYKF